MALDMHACRMVRLTADAASVVRAAGALPSEARITSAHADATATSMLLLAMASAPCSPKALSSAGPKVLSSAGA